MLSPFSKGMSMKNSAGHACGKNSSVKYRRFPTVPDGAHQRLFHDTANRKPATGALWLLDTSAFCVQVVDVTVIVEAAPLLNFLRTDSLSGRIWRPDQSIDQEFAS